MDANLHVNKEVVEAESLHGRRTEDSCLHNVLTETIRGLKAEKEDEESGRNAGEEREENECKQKVLGVLRELSVFHSDRVKTWGQVLRECAHMLCYSPPEGSDQQHPSTTDREVKVKPCSDSFSNIFLSVGEDIKDIIDKLNTIITKLDEEIHKLCAEKASTVDAALQETRDPKADGSERREDDNNHLNSHDPLDFDSGHKQEAEDGDDQSRTVPSPDTEQTSDSRFSRSDCSNVEETGKELEVKGQGSDNEDCVSPKSQTDFLEETEKYTNRVHDKSKEETNMEWITVGLAGQQEDSRSDVPDACFIRAPKGVAEVLRYEVADTLSGLMVTGSEELVSRVIRVKAQDEANFHFPVTVAVPFCARYRGNYKDVAVKIVDGGMRASYVTPVTTEGTYGGQRTGSILRYIIHFQDRPGQNGTVE